MDNINKYVELLEQRRKEQNIDNELSKSNLLKNSIENRFRELQTKSSGTKTVTPGDKFSIVKRVSIGTPFIQIDLKKVKEAIIQASKYEIRNKELIKIKESEDLKKYLQARFGKGFNSYKLLFILKSLATKFDFDFEENLIPWDKQLWNIEFFANSINIEMAYFFKYFIDRNFLHLIETEENRILLN